MVSRREARHTFTARVEAVSIGVPFYVVYVPASVSVALGRGRVPVVGTMNGKPIQTSLTPMAGGRHKMFLNRRIRETADVAPGDRVKVVLERDATPKEEPLPDDLVAALREADALGPFQRLSRSMKNEVVRWIEEAKTEPTREKRILRAVERGLAAHEKEVDREAARIPKASRAR
jgi:hypothetical protein